MEYAVKWMESGRDPKNNHRDAERSRVYYYDPVILDQMREKMSQKALIPAQADIEQVDSFLSACLTKREDDVYRLYIGEGMSMAKIGELLHIAKTSVQNLVERAENKVDEEKEQVRLF
jgi:RNA polymerase sigma-70 factor (ECF subfamily)